MRHAAMQDMGRPAAPVAESVSRCAVCQQAMRDADPLTGLGDRRFFRATLARRLAGLGAAGEQQLAVLMLDLDRFKVVNDSLGHPAGDVVLRTAARRLRRALRETDVCARLGGDEFAVVLGQPDAGAEAEALGQRIVEVLTEPYVVDGQVALLGASVGIAVAPEDAMALDALVAAADLALYAAKQAGRGMVRRFEPAMRARATERRVMEQELRAALPLGQLELHYQPEVAVRENRLTGFEALLRWRHPRHGLLRPDAFLRLAMESGMIQQLGQWTLREACRAAAGWPEPLRVSVNVTSLELEAGHVLRAATQALAEARLPPGRLEIEITEAALMHPTQATLLQLDGLRTLGVPITLDDFGTGFASLSQLRRFPFDRIKIDRSFAGDAAVLQAIAGLGAALGMRTTAEGVETEAQLDAVRGHGCTGAQGYLLGRPITAADVAPLIARWQSLSGDAGLQAVA